MWCIFRLMNWSCWNKDYLSIYLASYLLVIICGFLYVNKLKKQNPFRSFQLQFEKRLQKVILMHARKRSLPLARGETWRSIEDIFLKSKTSSRFPNFDANGCFGKYTTTHERVFFLGKSCSWTLLPKSIWPQMPLTWLWYISCLQSFRTHSCLWCLSTTSHKVL